MLVSLNWRRRSSAIGRGDVDAVVLYDHAGNPQLFTLRGADTPYQLLVEQMREGALTVRRRGHDPVRESAFRRDAGRGLGKRHRRADRRLRGADGCSTAAPIVRRLSIRRRRCATRNQLASSLRHRAACARLDQRLTETDHVCIVVTDLTEQKAGEERQQMLLAERVARSEAERSSLLKGRIRRDISHELRTPLNAILGWSQVLCARAPQDGGFRSRPASDRTQTRGPRLS
jgi:signal transduction histidine kinase